MLKKVFKTTIIKDFKNRIDNLFEEISREFGEDISRIFSNKILSKIAYYVGYHFIRFLLSLGVSMIVLLPVSVVTAYPLAYNILTMVQHRGLVG